MATNAAYNINTAPLRQPQKNPKPSQPGLRPVKRPEKNPRQAAREQREAYIFTAKVCAVAVMFIALFAVMLYGKFQLNAINLEINRYQQKLEVAQSEGVRLSMESSSKVSLDKVENYAVTNLGMVKKENYRGEYVTIDESKTAGEKGGNTSAAGESKNISADSEKQSILSYIFQN